MTRSRKYKYSESGVTRIEIQNIGFNKVERVIRYLSRYFRTIYLYIRMSSIKQLLSQCSDMRQTLVVFCQKPESFVLSKEQAECPGYNMTNFLFNKLQCVSQTLIGGVTARKRHCRFGFLTEIRIVTLSAHRSTEPPPRIEPHIKYACQPLEHQQTQSDQNI